MIRNKTNRDFWRAAGSAPISGAFMPRTMGVDVDLSEAKKRVGDKICMIGGFDQFHYFLGCSPQETRAAVRKCFDQAGENGGFILAPSDHFFDADLELIQAFVEQARQCF